MPSPRAPHPESSPESPLQPFPGRPGSSSDARPDVDGPWMSRSPFLGDLPVALKPLTIGRRMKAGECFHSEPFFCLHSPASQSDRGSWIPTRSSLYAETRAGHRKRQNNRREYPSQFISAVIPTLRCIHGIGPVEEAWKRGQKFCQTLSLSDPCSCQTTEPESSHESPPPAVSWASRRLFGRG